MIMPLNQVCGWCGSSFEGSDCMGYPCPSCEDALRIQLKGIEVDPTDETKIKVSLNRALTETELKTLTGNLAMALAILPTPGPY